MVDRLVCADGGNPDPAGRAVRDRYIGYYEPYATSHDTLDADHAVQEEVRNVAREVLATVKLLRDEKYRVTARDLRDPRPK